MDAQRADGGFGGRRGASDLYYTAFALRAAELLDLPDRSFYLVAVNYLRRHAPAPRTVVDAASLLFIEGVLARRGIEAWCDDCRDERRAIAQMTLARFHRDGGYALELDGVAALYATFLGLLCRTMLQAGPTPEVEGIARAVTSRQRADGGFSDLPGEDSGTNPTAAAVATLSMLDALEADVASRAAAFLRTMQREDGGFAAHASAPVSDLLSTSSAVVALGRIDPDARLRAADVARFVKSLHAPAGGFRGAPGDDAADVEYTYYGLATLGLLASRLG